MWGRFSLVILGGWIGYCSAALAQPAKANKTVKTHMFWHLTPSGGATPEKALRIERVLRSFFDQRYGRALMDGMTMDSMVMVAGNEKYMRCGMGAACLSGLGQLAGMNFVIGGEVGVVQGRTTTRLVLVDAAGKQVGSSASVQSAGPPGPHLLEELGVAMFQPGRYKGSIELKVAVEGAEVLVDGRKVAVTPLAGPLTDLPAGRRLIEVKKDGHQPFAQTVRVPMGKSTRVVADLPEAPYLKAEVVEPFYQDWPFWTGVGVGVVGIAVAGALHYDAGVLQDKADECRRRNLGCADKNQEQADSRSIQAYVMYSVGGAGLLAAGLIAVLDAVDSDSKEAEPTAAVELGVAPRPGGFGLQATWRF